LRTVEENRREKHQVWACGGGVQSTAIAALITLGKLPKPAHAWIVDVGWEKASTFDYVKAVLIPKLNDAGVTLQVIKTKDYRDNSLVDKGNNINLPVYEALDGVVRKFDTRCSGSWKQKVAAKWLREQGVERCDTWVGISIDEKRRMKPSAKKWNQNRYPLIELGLRREDCIDLIARMGWLKPEHTSCYLCPNQGDFQWQTLKERFPSDFQKAVEAERFIQTVNPNVYFHRLCKSLDSIRFDAFGVGSFFIGKECFGDCGPAN
jgi:hypothetical protein